MAGLEDQEWHLRGMVERKRKPSMVRSFDTNELQGIVDALLKLTPEAHCELAGMMVAQDAQVAELYNSEFTQRLHHITKESYVALQEKRVAPVRKESNLDQNSAGSTELTSVTCQEQCCPSCEPVFKTNPSTWERIGHPVPTSCHACRAFRKEELTA